MRKIEVKEWKVANTENKEDILIVLNVLISMKKPEELPRGFEQFKLFKKLSNAFDKARETKVLVLEEPEYKFLKDVIITDIPSQWGSSKDIFEAVDSFMNAKEE